MELLVNGQVEGSGGVDLEGAFKHFTGMIPGFGNLVQQAFPVWGTWKYDDRAKTLTLDLTTNAMGQTNRETITVHSTGREKGQVQGQDLQGRTYRMWRR